jgi:hypothetical protein
MTASVVAEVLGSREQRDHTKAPHTNMTIHRSAPAVDHA